MVKVEVNKVLDFVINYELCATELKLIKTFLEHDPKYQGLNAEQLREFTGFKQTHLFNVLAKLRYKNLVETNKEWRNTKYSLHSNFLNVFK
jgi:DNA-binding MarR family transcriptional regulator